MLVGGKGNVLLEAWITEIKFKKSCSPKRKAGKKKNERE